MSLNTLVDYISNSQITSELIKRISKNNELNIIGSSRYAKSIILDSIAKKEEKNILLICPNVEIAYKWIGYFESINNKNIIIPGFIDLHCHGGGGFDTMDGKDAIERMSKYHLSK